MEEHESLYVEINLLNKNYYITEIIRGITL
jgi:hypothetical protein